MKTKIIFFVLVAFLLVANVLNGTAQRGQHNKANHRNERVIRQNKNNNRVVIQNENRRTIVVRDNRFRGKRQFRHHNVIVVKPRVTRVISRHEGYNRYVYRDVEYFYNQARFYRRLNGVYTIVAPPFGLHVNVMPVGYRTIVYRQVPYFYYQGVFYHEIPAEQSYQVVEPPIGAVVPELPFEDVEEVRINGQTYFEYGTILYQPITTRNGIQYKVSGILQD